MSRPIRLLPGSGSSSWRQRLGADGLLTSFTTETPFTALTSIASWRIWISLGCARRPRAPTANAVAERLVRTIRTERLDHLIVIDQQHLRAVLAEFADYYNRDRPHRSLGLQSPLPRAVRKRGRVVSRPVLGGLHHVYARVAAHVGLDQVDGGEIWPLDPVGLLGFAVIAEQDVGRGRGDDPPVRQRRAGAVQAIDLLRGADIGLDRGANRGRNRTENRRYPIRVGRKQVVGTLLAPAKAEVFLGGGIRQADSLLDAAQLGGHIGRVDDGDVRRGCRRG